MQTKHECCAQNHGHEEPDCIQGETAGEVGEELTSVQKEGLEDEVPDEIACE